MSHPFQTQREWETDSEYAARVQKFLRRGDLYDKTDPAKRNLVASEQLAQKPKTKARQV